MSDARPRGVRRTIRNESTYPEAERVVDRLSDAGFDVGRVVIVGTGLRYVEQVAGRLTTWRAAGIGAAQGATYGLLFGLLFGLFFDDAGDFLAVVVYGLGLGALWGGLFGAILHLAQRGSRDFTSQVGAEAESYEIQVDDEVAAEAARLLDRPVGGESRPPESATNGSAT